MTAKRTPTTTSTDTTTTTTAPTRTATTTEAPTRKATPTAAPTRTATTPDPGRMAAVDQTHPYTNGPFGFAVYGRGVATDGGGDQPEDSMEDVDHEAPNDGANRSFERGTESSDE